VTAVALPADRPRGDGRVVDGRIVLALLAPTIAIYAVCFLAPTALLLGRSLFAEGVPTLAHYEEILSTPLYIGVIWTTLWFSVVTTAACLLLGYPIAMVLARTRGFARGLLLVLVVVPYWLDYVVRTYSWMVLLGRNGFLNQVLVALGLVEVPASHLGTDAAVLVGMVQVMLPLMVLSLYAAMRRIDPELMRAAAAHGAGGWASFRRIFLPLSAPGIVAGTLLTFVNTLGFYITPALLGGPKQTMISQSIDMLASKLLDWPLASAAAVLLLVVTIAILVAFNRVFGFDRTAGGA
jgi:ABC-type spermidine/putrescine transport system permease subunit I